MEFICRWFKKLVSNGAIRQPFQGMKACLLYADDALFFVKPEIQQLQMLKIAFIAFEEISGLAVNLHKSELMLSIDCNHQGAQLSQMMGCKLGTFPFIYLGLPLSIKTLKKEAYLPLMHKFQKRLVGWAAKYLSIAGRIVLVNAVLSSIPIYYMSVIKLPAWVVKEIDLTMLMNWIWQWIKPEDKMWKSAFTITNHEGTGMPNSIFFTKTLASAIYFCNTSIMRILGNGEKTSF